MNLEAFYSYLEHEKRYSKNTIEAYRTDVTQFSAYLALQYGNLSLQKATQPIIRSWLLSLIEAQLSSKSVNRKISTLRTLYKFLRKFHGLKEDPTENIIAPKIGKQIPHFVKEEEMKKLLEQIEFKEDFSGVRDKLIIELFYQTGIRTSELLTLKEKSVDFSTKSIRVLGKRNKERDIPLSSKLLNLIDEYLVKKRETFKEQNPYLIVLDSGKNLYRKFAYTKVKYYLTQVSSLKKKSPHILRHTFATHMLKNGADLNAIKELLGHASLAATQVYAHNTLEQLKEVHKMAHPRNEN